jgi:hypothetical protein
MEAAQALGAEEDVPLAIVVFDEARVLFAEGLAHVDPLFVPPAVAAHAVDRVERPNELPNTRLTRGMHFHHSGELLPSIWTVYPMIEPLLYRPLTVDLVAELRKERGLYIGEGVFSYRCAILHRSRQYGSLSSTLRWSSLRSPMRRANRRMACLQDDRLQLMRISLDRPARGLAPIAIVRGESPCDPTCRFPGSCSA